MSPITTSSLRCMPPERVRAPPQLGAGHAVELALQRQVLGRRGLKVYRRLLRHEADHAAHALRIAQREHGTWPDAEADAFECLDAARIGLRESLDLDSPPRDGGLC